MKWNEIIKALREDHDLTQTQMGKILHVNQITVSQYERGVRQINPNTIIAYAQFFNVSTDYILGLTSSPTPTWTNSKKNITNSFNNNSGSFGDITIK